MKLHIHRITRGRIARHFTDGLGAGARARLWESLDNCERCAAAYRQYGQLEGALFGSPSEPSPALIDRLESAIFEVVDERASVSSRSWVRWLPAASGAAAVVAVGFFLLISQLGPASHRVALDDGSSMRTVEWQARGSAGTTRSEFGVRAFAVGLAGVDETRRLGIDDVLTFTYSRAPAGKGHLMLLGLQEFGDDLLWYYPDYGARQSVSIAGDTIDEPLGDGVDLSVNHRPGVLHVVALFSETPLSVEAVEMVIRRVRAANPALKQYPRLLIDGLDGAVSTYLLELRIDGREE